jgi:uracil-DNA glycosylase family 4
MSDPGDVAAGIARRGRSVVRCRRCPELRAYCAEVGRTKRRAYRDWTYWAKPVPGFGDPAARLIIVGLAPAAHGANRTGRMFTGDRSGDFLYAALHRAGLASQAASVSRDDGLTLRGVYITAALRCAPPGNRPTREQLEHCRPHLVDELTLMRPRVLLCLGSIAWNAALEAWRVVAGSIPRPRPRFGHGAECSLDGVVLLGSYHVSQQNTFTGRLTPSMLDEVLARAKHHAAA